MKDRSLVLPLVVLLAVLLTLSGGCSRNDSAAVPPAEKVTTPPQDPVSAVRFLLQRGNVVAAAQQADAALLRDPGDPGLLSIAGDVAVARRDATRAVELYELALAATDDHVADEEAVVREIDKQGAIIQGEYSDVDDIFFQRPEDE